MNVILADNQKKSEGFVDAKSLVLALAAVILTVWMGCSFFLQ